MKALLAFDTATSTASVALLDLDSGRVVSALQAPVETHGKALVPMIQKALEQASVRPADLAAVACGKGPGSFTGVRVGLATAKGLCLVLEIPLILPGSLTALAMRAPPSPGLVVPCLDARRSEVYVSAVRWQGSLPVEEILPECAVGPQAVFELFRIAMDPSHAPAEGEVPRPAMQAAIRGAEAISGMARPLPVTVVGEGVVRYREVLVRPRLWSEMGVDLHFFDVAPPVPDAVSLARLAAWMLERGEVADVDRSQPVYLRPSDAEAKFKLDLSPK